MTRRTRDPQALERVKQATRQYRSGRDELRLAVYAAVAGGNSYRAISEAADGEFTHATVSNLVRESETAVQVLRRLRNSGSSNKGE